MNGKTAAIQNVVPTKQGLQLWVRKASGDSIPMAEISTQRMDLLYGSFRVKAKMTGVNGTCGAFFWFRNNTQEIDMEFLSKQYADSPGGIVNLVNQSPESQAAGFNAAYTPGYGVQHLPFRPDADFHEYRFDWVPGSISYYADGVLLRVFQHDIPNSPGHMVLNHWSNGDAGWSAGPPIHDTAITIQYTHLYFNSSEPRELQRFSRACPEADAAKICTIDNADALMPPVSTTGNSFIPAYDGPGGMPPASAPSSQSSKKYLIAGLCVSVAIITFVLAMMTVRHWPDWRRRLLSRRPKEKYPLTQER